MIFKIILRVTVFIVFMLTNTLLLSYTLSDSVKYDPYVLYRQNYFDIQKYTLNLSFYLEADKIYGNAKIDAQCLNDSMSHIYLNLSRNNYVNYVRLNGRPAISYNSDEYIVVSTEDLIRKNDYFELEIDYDIIVENELNNCIYAALEEGKYYANNISSVFCSEKWFPSKILLTDKFTLVCNITVPYGYFALSNGNSEGVDVLKDKKIFKWKTFYPVSRQYVGFSVGDFLIDTLDIEYSSGNKQFQFINYFAKSFDRADFNDSAITDIFNYYLDVYGEFPFAKEKYSFVFTGQNESSVFQNFSIIGCPEEFNNDVYVKMAEKFSYSWIGNAVTVENHKDNWIVDGLSGYFKALWIRKLKGDEEFRTYMENISEKVSEISLYDDKNILLSAPNDKGCWVFHMIRGITGDSVFYSIIREFYQKYRYKTADTRKFIEVCNNVSGFNFDEFFDQWVFGNYPKPEYKFEWNSDIFVKEDNNDFYMLRLSYEQIKPDSILYKLPLRFTICTDKDTIEQKFLILKRKNSVNLPVLGKPVSVILDKDNWILRKF
ncbi:MAG: M1 family metallopeptidase [Ignavibacteria bacterium]|nr:M1 family metallopeptidase [Ignavibacteria bacterium]